MRIRLKSLLNKNFIRFSITGGLGTITNLLIFYILCDRLNLSTNIGAIISFSIAVTQNYIINHFWSFKEYSKNNKITFLSYIKFVAVSLFGLAINLAVLNLILLLFKLPLKVIAQVIGILAGFILNYLGAKLFVFTKKKIMFIGNK